MHFWRLSKYGLGLGPIFLTAIATIAGPVPTNKPAHYPDWWFEQDVIARLPAVATKPNPVWPADYPAADDYAAAGPSVRRDGSIPNPFDYHFSEELIGSEGNDPILMVGNEGAYGYQMKVGSAGPSNALTVYRDGQANFADIVRVPAGGDIPMGIYAAKPTGVAFP